MLAVLAPLAGVAGAPPASPPTAPVNPPPAAPSGDGSAIGDDLVTVQIVATDTEPDDQEDAEPDAERPQTAKIDL